MNIKSELSSFFEYSHNHLSCAGSRSGSFVQSTPVASEINFCASRSFILGIISGIIGNSPGVKPEEIEHIGLADWLKSKNRPGQNRLPLVTRDEINQYILHHNWQMEKTGTGLRYIIMKKGKGTQPKSGDFVSVNYKISLINILKNKIIKKNCQ